MRGPLNTLQQDKAELAGEIKSADVCISKNLRPYVIARFTEGGIITFGPLEYMAVSIDCGKRFPAIKELWSTREPYAIWKHLPEDPSFLVGRVIEFQNHLVTLDAETEHARTFNSFRYRRVRK